MRESTQRAPIAVRRSNTRPAVSIYPEVRCTLGAMPLEPTTIRWDPDVRALIERQAKRRGVSFSTYVTTAGLTRAIVDEVRYEEARADELVAVYVAAERWLTRGDPLAV